MQIAPSADLCRLVKHYLIIDHQAASEGIYRFFPDGNPGLVFSYADPLLEHKRQQAATNALVDFVYGHANQYHDLKAGKTIGLLIVVFQPWGLHTISGVPGQETTNLQVRLEHLFGPSASALQAQLLDCFTLSERISFIEDFLRKRKLVPSPDESLLQMAVQRIQQTNGQLPIGQLLQQLATTERSLERRFVQVMGIGPKQFSRIIRLQHCLKIQRQQPALSLTELAYAAGYYDQAHFIREFTQLAGVTPKQYDTSPARLAVNLMPLPA
ncbi:helix-turn-helix domain-containing protein [Spirosoma knui]